MDHAALEGGRRETLSGGELDSYVDRIAEHYESLTHDEARIIDQERLVPCKETARLIRLAQQGEFSSRKGEQNIFSDKRVHTVAW